MTKLTIYRFENARGQGPWSAYVYRPYIGCKLPPPPADEADDGPVVARFPSPWGLKCGTLSPEQLAQWFDEGDREFLVEKGFAVHAYEVPETAVWRGGHQAVFEKKKAKRIGALDPIALTPILTA